MNKICAVIVTYGNRAYLVKQVVERAREEGIKEIILVDNGSPKYNNDSLKKLNVNLITLEDNTGSAGGFRKGLIAASKSKMEYILCLDDDNILQKGTINYLSSFLPLTNDVLFCMRYYDERFLTKTKRELEIKFLEKDILNVNSFCYFSIDKAINTIRRLFSKRVPNNKEVYRTVANGYGGMFFNKHILSNVGYPNEKFYLYFDDIEYTYRMFKAGFRLYLLSRYKIKDIDQTLIKGKARNMFDANNILENIRHMSAGKLHYGYKNRVALEKNYNNK